MDVVTTGPLTPAEGPPPTDPLRRYPGGPLAYPRLPPVRTVPFYRGLFARHPPFPRRLKRPSFWYLLLLSLPSLPVDPGHILLQCTSRPPGAQLWYRRTARVPEDPVLRPSTHILTSPRLPSSLPSSHFLRTQGVHVLYESTNSGRTPRRTVRGSNTPRAPTTTWVSGPTGHVFGPTLPPPRSTGRGSEVVSKNLGFLITPCGDLRGLPLTHPLRRFNFLFSHTYTNTRTPHTHTCIYVKYQCTNGQCKNKDN